MKKFELNPKEELNLETQPDVITQTLCSNRPVLFGSIVLVLLFCFFLYVTQSIPNFYPLVILIGIIAIVAIAYYVISLFLNKKNNPEKYYITSNRVVVCDNQDNVKNEVKINTINQVVVNKVKGNISDVILNPKEETNPAKLRKHTSNKPLYTLDTVILKAVDVQKVREIIKK